MIKSIFKSVDLCVNVNLPIEIVWHEKIMKSIARPKPVLDNKDRNESWQR